MIDISMMNCQQTDHFEEDESNSSAAECSDSDCDMSRDQQDKEQGLLKCLKCLKCEGESLKQHRA